MAIDFPNSPSLNQEFTVGARTWKWNGSTWAAVTTPSASQGTQGTTGITGLQGLTGLQGSQGIQGTIGPQSSQGTTGSVTGVTVSFSTNTVVWVGTATTGQVRFNNSTISSVTSIFIAESNTAVSNFTSVLDRWSGSSTLTDRGTLTIADSAYENIIVFEINGAITDNGTYRTIPVSYVTGALPADGATRYIHFRRTGNRGTQGVTGGQGPTGAQGTTGVQGITGIGTTQNYTAGYYYDTVECTSAPATLAIVQGRLFLVPFAVHRTITVTTMSVDHTGGGGTSGTVIRLGLYNYDLTDNEPGALIIDAGTVAAVSTATGIKTTSAFSQQLTPGLYFAAAVAQGSASNPTVRVYNNVNPYFMDNAISTGGTIIGAYYDDGVTGALSGTPVIDGVARPPRIILGL